MKEAEKSKLIQEIATWKYLATTLDQDHQISVKNDILRKVDALNEQLKQAINNK